MITAQDIIDRLKLVSGYTNIDFAVERQPDISNIGELPAIRVNYTRIYAENPNKDLSYGSFLSHNEDLRQTFIIQIVCSVADFDTVFDNLFNKGQDEATKFIGWNPRPEEINATPINYIDGNVVGLTQGNLRFDVVVAVGFPIFKL